MSLSHHVVERLKITSNTKPLRLQPSTWDELRAIIEQELKEQGPDADLNFIDTSEITNMAGLFYKLNIRNIKIDEWDVSNVTNMSNMFFGCKEFNCDLSNWDIQKVEVIAYLFYKCHLFNCDLSEWNPMSVKSANYAFAECTSFKSDLSGWKMPKLWAKAADRMFYKCRKMTRQLKPAGI